MEHGQEQLDTYGEFRELCGNTHRFCFSVDVVSDAVTIKKRGVNWYLQDGQREQDMKVVEHKRIAYSIVGLARNHHEIYH